MLQYAVDNVSSFEIHLLRMSAVGHVAIWFTSDAIKICTLIIMIIIFPVFTTVACHYEGLWKKQATRQPVALQLCPEIIKQGVCAQETGMLHAGAILCSQQLLFTDNLQSCYGSAISQSNYFFYLFFFPYSVLSPWLISLTAWQL